jgi:hypothetical protein
MNGTRKATYAEIARKIREIPLDEPVSSHEWDELVKKMCDSEDAGLQDIGRKAHDVLNKPSIKYDKR